jgi:hypothetical protein
MIDDKKEIIALDKVFQTWVPEKKGGERKSFADVETAKKWLWGD